jgi:hypothetical protein
MHTRAQKPKATLQTTAAKPKIPCQAHLEQRTIENQAVHRLLEVSTRNVKRDSVTDSASVGHDFSQISVHPGAQRSIQPKLEISAPGDRFEQEADRVAAQVMRMPEPQRQRACAYGGECPKCQQEQPGHNHGRLQTRRAQDSDTGQMAAPPIVHGAIAAPGQPLDSATRAFFEPRFGYDFSTVRVHSGAAAEQSASNVNALAYTVGRDIVFGAGRFTPGTQAGRWLIAHELAHVVQNGAGAPAAIRRKVPGAQCTGVRITLPNTIVFEGNQGSVAATVKTTLTPSDTPYSIEYNPGEGQFSIKPGEKVVVLDVSLTNKPQNQIDLYIAYRDSLTSKPAGLEVFSSSATAVGGMDPRHARGYGGEQSMGFGYSEQKGWILIEGPSGAAGHGVTTSGFDGVTYSVKADELHLIDNKSLKAETVRSATAITKNLLKNLDGLIGKVEGMKDMPSQPRILQLLKQMRSAVAAGTKLPNNTKLIVTGEGGQAKGVSESLEKLGVEFREPGTTDLPPANVPEEASVTPETTGKPGTTAAPEGVTGENVTPVETPEEFTPAPEGEPGVGGGLFGFFFPLIGSIIHQKAVERRIEEKAHKEGYVPRGAPSGEGFLYDLGSFFLDPGNDADKAVSLDKRFDLPVWRQHIREVSAGKRPGETLKMQWDVGKCSFDFLGRQEVDTKYVTYKKQPDGSWKVESGDASGTPDLNDIISPAVGDEKIKAIVYNDPCLA